MTLVKLLGVLLVTGILAAGILVPVIGGIGITGKAEADRFNSTDCELDESPPSTRTTLLASDGKTPIAYFFAQNRIPVDLTAIPTFMQQALVDTEDRRFFDHHGVDARGLIRAAISNSEGGDDTQGGSTLTMQYVKQLRYYNANTDAAREAATEQTVERKIQDAKCALELEKAESKQDILQGYFNITFFGENSYGAQAAAQTYFSKNVQDLTLPEAAMIVGLPRDPTFYDPYQNSKNALDRRNTVIDNMVTAGHVTAADAAAAKAAPLGLSTALPPPVQQGCAYALIPNAGFFCDYARTWLAEHGIGQDILDNSGLTIVSTLDAQLQTNGQNRIWSGDPDVRGGPFAKDSVSSLVMPSVDPRNGAVTTMITSRRYGLNQADPDQTAVPLFTTAAAGAGSTYKYFTALLAMEAGVSDSYTLTAGAPYTAKNCPKDIVGGVEKPYVAENAGNYAATLPLNKALYESSNTYFVGVEDMLFNCNTRPIAAMALNLGMSALQSKFDAGLLDRTATFTLGQESTSPLQLASAYATVANDGVYCPPTAVVSVTDRDGQPVDFTKDPCQAKIDPQIARRMVDILVDDTKVSGGTATSRFYDWYGEGGSNIASKTGTNNATSQNSNGDYVDNGTNSAIWFVGLTPTLVSAATVYNIKAATKTIRDLPGYPDSYASGDAFGAAAGAYWLKAYGPRLASLPWTWPSPSAVPGVTVPSVVGDSPAEATATLQAAGFAVNVLPFQCGSRYSAGDVSGFSPSKAQPGSTVNVCVSNGKAPTSYSSSYGSGSSSGGGTTTRRSPGTGSTGGGGGGGATNPGPGAGAGTTVGDAGRPNG